MDAVEQQLAAEGLLEVVERAGLQRVHRGLDVAVAGHDDDRQPDIPNDELSLEPEASHAGEAQLEHETSRTASVQRVEERLGRGVRLDGEPHRGAELPERLACGRVVIHDEDTRLHAAAVRLVGHTALHHRCGGVRRSIVRTTHRHPGDPQVPPSQCRAGICSTRSGTVAATCPSTRTSKA